jgi:glycosyltransferase involved in cell wall biosynthesis
VIRPTKLVKYLGPLGWRSTVLCRSDPAPVPADETLLAQVPAGTRVVRIRQPLAAATTGIADTARTRLPRRSVRFRVLRAVRDAVVGVYATPDRLIGWALRAAFWRDTGERPDVVVSSGPPHSAHIAGAVLAARSGVPFVMDLRDEWSPNPFFHRGSPLGRALDRALERACLARADAIVVTTPASLDLYRRTFPAAARRSALIANGYDPEDLPTGTALPPPSGGIVLAYAGSLLMKRDGGPVFEAFARAVARRAPMDPPLRLLLIGAFRPEQEAAARSVVPPEHIEIVPFLPQRDALERLATSHVLVHITGTEEGGETAIAGKLYEYLALRRPILAVAPDGSAAARLVLEAGAGVAADPHDPAALDRGIDAVIALAMDGSFGGAPDELITRFDRRAQAATWDALLRRAIGDGGAADASLHGSSGGPS